MQPNSTIDTKANDTKSWFDTDTSKTVFKIASAMTFIAIDIALIGFGAPFFAGASLALVKGAFDNKDTIAKYGNKLINWIKKDNSNELNQPSKESEIESQSTKNNAVENVKNNQISTDDKQEENQPSEEHHFVNIVDPNHIHNNGSAKHHFVDIVDPKHTHNDEHNSFVEKLNNKEPHFQKEAPPL